MGSQSQNRLERKEKKRKGEQQQQQQPKSHPAQCQTLAGVAVTPPSEHVPVPQCCWLGVCSKVAFALCQYGPASVPARSTDAHDERDATFREEFAVLIAEGPIATMSLSQRCPSRVSPCLFAGEFHLASSLLSLDLSQNKLRDLPASIGSLISLTDLNVSRNWLRALPKEIADLTRLVTIDALVNDLQPKTFCIDELSTLPHLQVLDLRYNDKLKETMADLLAARLPTVECRVTVRVPFSERLHAADRDGRLLRSQLEPLCTLTLRRRLALIFGEPTNPAVVLREEVMRKLLSKYDEAGPRAERPVAGVPVSDALCEELLAAMKAWVKADDATRSLRERPTIRAQHYMIIRSPSEFEDKQSNNAVKAASKLRQHEGMWALARKIINEADSDFAQKYTAVAFTHNFEGSPHIDTQNIGPFYGLALGDFSAGGGALCVECSAREVAYVDTRNRLGKVDGRFPHWVAPYTGDRYSVIYYQTMGEATAQSFAVFSGKPLVCDPPTFCPSGYQYKYNVESETFFPTEDDKEWLRNRA